MKIVVAGEGEEGVGGEACEDVFGEVGGFEVFLHEGEQVVHCVWDQVPVLFLLYRSFGALVGATVWSVVVVPLRLGDLFSLFQPACIFWV